MPTIYRPMKTDEDMLPRCGAASKELGVRIPPNEHSDVDVTEENTVVLNRRGMSVGRHWTSLPGHLIPKRLVQTFPGATGSNSLSCYRFGHGEFTDGTITNDLLLALKPNSTTLGNLVPAYEMSVESLQTALGQTRERWVVDEDLP